MNQDLSYNIRRKLTEGNLSISALERIAGLKQSAVQNVLNGRSKRPSVIVVQAVADALRCSVSELLGESSEKPCFLSKNNISTNLQRDPKREKFMQQYWDLDYHMRCVALIRLIGDKHMLKDKFDRIVEEIYYYSHRDGLAEPDRRYAARLLETMT